MKIRLSILICIFFLSLTTTLFAQNTIRGTVSGTGGVLSGVTVQVKGTNTVAQTDDAGRFSIAAPANSTLQVSYVGYDPLEERIGNRTTLNLTMTPVGSSLNDVVVIGYGTQKRKDVIGAVSSVAGDKIAQRPVATFDQALQGMAPGLQIAQRNSSPGELSTINLRGIGSLSAGFEPLFVVDGFPTDQRNATAINPADIQSIEILKDAASTAIFGSRGANGVIIISTKTGKGKAQLNVNISSGISTVDKHLLYDEANSQEYVQYYKEYYTNLGMAVPPAIANYDGKTNTDWQSLVYKTKPFQNYSVSANGGDEKVSWLFSGNYIHQPGIIIGEGFDRYAARIKVDYRPSKSITLGLNLAPNFELTKRSSPKESDAGSLQSMAGLMPPIVPVRKADGSYATFNDVLPGVFNNIANPLQVAENWREKTNAFLSLFNAYGQIRLIDGLIYKTSVSGGITYNNHKLFWQAPDGPALYGFPATTTLNLDNSQTLNWLIENTLNYKRVFHKVHSIDLLAGYTGQKVASTYLAAGTNTFNISGPETLGFGSSVNRVANNGAGGNTLISYLGRVNYAYNDKYILTASIRRDGSSRFGVNNRYHTFGSVGLGWRITDEKFMEGVTFINNAKIRASYGTTGSNDISDFTSRASLRSVNQSFNGTQVIGVRNQDPGNSSLTWETSKQANVGFDADFIHSKLNVIFDYYRNETQDLLLQQNVVLSSGFPGVLTNIGKVRNKGFELSLNYRIIDTKDISWSLGGNVTHNEQKILSLGGQNELFNFFGALRSRVGYEIQEIQGVRAIGVVREGHIPAAQPEAKPGDIIFEDVNKDGQVSNFLGPDGVFLGEPNLDWVYGVNTSFRYRNWSLSALVNGQNGGSTFDFYLIQVANAVNGVNFSKKFWYDGRYVSESQPGDGHTPRAGGLTNSAAGAGFVSSLGVQKTDFVRVRNVTVSYSIPASAAKKIFATNAQAYLSIENLYTFTNYIGGNPYSQRPSAGGPGLIGGSRLVGDGRELALNSVGSAPLPKVLTIGINVTF